MTSYHKMNEEWNVKPELRMPLKYQVAIAASIIFGIVFWIGVTAVICAVKGY